MENYIALYAKVRKILCGKLAKGYICTITDLYIGPLAFIIPLKIQTESNTNFRLMWPRHTF